MGYGMAGHVMADIQTAFGTAKVTSLQALPVIDESFEFTINPIVEKGMYGRFGESPYQAGAYLVNGAINMEAHGIAMGTLIKAVFGTCATTSGTGIQTHVFKPCTQNSEFSDRAAVNPVTFEVNRDVGSAFQYYDCVGNTLDISITNGAIVNMSASFIGAAMTRASKATPTYPTANPFLWDQCSASFNSAAIVDLRSVQVSYKNNLEAQYTLNGSKAPYRVKRTAHEQVEVSGQVVFAQHSYMQAFEAQSETPFTLFFTGAQAPYTFKIDVPKLRFKTFAPKNAGPGLVEASFTAQGIFSTTSLTSIELTLVNTQTYY